MAKKSRRDWRAKQLETEVKYLRKWWDWARIGLAYVAGAISGAFLLMNQLLTMGEKSWSEFWTFLMTP